MRSSHVVCASGVFDASPGVSVTNDPIVAFEIEPRGPFALSAAREFLEGFTPGRGSSVADGGQLALAFRLDATFAPVVASLTEHRGVIHGRAAGSDDAPAVARQVARILSLDVDGRGWPAVGERDPVVAELQRRFPGARPVCFPSPYEAAAWGVLSQRTSMRQAAVWKAALAMEHGDRVALDGATLSVFPGPMALGRIQSCSSIPREKLQRLHAVAEAAQNGMLDAERLRGLPEREALAQLETIRGIGNWTAQHILMRGAGLADALPLAEPRALRGMASAYGLPRIATEIEYATIAKRWRPYAMWVAVLLVRSIADTAQWHGTEKRG